MTWKWLPWEFFIRTVARRHGFIDPFAVFARIAALSQPTRTLAPVELLRAGAVLHARGFLNNHVIQHNLDWVWPMWVERQFDPRHPAFIPRAFSMTHINLTQRNWTAVGYPGCPETPVVDGAGLLMPTFDSWSLDAWFLPDEGEPLVPSRLPSHVQRLETEGNLAVVTESSGPAGTLTASARVELEGALPVCRLEWTAQANGPGWLAVSLRPYNPEGISLVSDLSLLAGAGGWEINHKDIVRLEDKPDRTLLSRYRDGDVFAAAKRGEFVDRLHVQCDVGMATGAALYRMEAGGSRTARATVPLVKGKSRRGEAPLFSIADRWKTLIEPCAVYAVPADPSAPATPLARDRFLYDAALRTVILLSPREVFAGPYTYKRFWYRDAAIILHAVMCSGQRRVAEKALDYCVEQQSLTGYFKSQEGEWDSNGQVLWALGRYCRLFNVPPKRSWIRPIVKAVSWIRDKRLDGHLAAPESGLLPAGFSAEHLGPNDYYYWDDFWTLAGLRLAEEMLEAVGETESAALARSESESLSACIDASLQGVAAKLGTPAMPASPYRRLDSGSVGSLAAGFPLQLWPARDERITATAAYLRDHCRHGGALYHDISHSGINPYLSLHLAQCLLREGDNRFREVMDAIGGLATATGQWPEAIHPQLRTGCMGDGQHAWAAAEWLMMVRNTFLFEEEYENLLVLGAGLDADGIPIGDAVSFGPAPTRFGMVEVRLAVEEGAIQLTCKGRWYGAAPKIEPRFTPPEGYGAAVPEADGWIYRKTGGSQ